ncbi:MAG TPA: prolyl oligopeptidase family serine peptidase [Candidatus Thermoplasmatota archaeon]|nr:prolyl oligopeptidase family serine peptidase [Candidatus Thermoplasmatota archaeon]
MRRLGIALLLVALLLPGTSVGSPPSGITTEWVIVPTEGGATVDGYLAYPTSGTPTTLVVMAHGVGNTVQGAWTGHVEETASHGAVALAINFRDNLGFPVMQGAEDLNNAALQTLARFPTIDTVVLFGVSMGGAVSGTALTLEAERAPGVPLWDYWFDIEGVSNLFETYYQAKAVGHSAAAGIERDAGGSPEQVPAAFVARSPALNAHKMGYLKGAFLVHALNDGTVPYNQGREMQAGLTAAGVTTEFVTILGEERDHTEGTTGTGRIFGLAKLPDPSEVSTLHLAGHAWEGDREARVMAYGFERLFALLAGESFSLPKDDVHVGPVLGGVLA